MPRATYVDRSETIETAAPARLRAVQAPTHEEVEPGGVLRRFAAVLIDGMVLGMLTFPIALGLGMAFKLANPHLGMLALLKENGNLFNLVSYGLNLPILILYYGWFYKNRGGTPGKLLLGLRVVNKDDGLPLTYLQTIIRETFGRIVDAIPLGIGLLVGAFRRDKRCFHDMMCGSQVIRKR